MKHLYLEEYDAFIRYYDISGEGETLVFLPGLSVASIANFLSVTTNPKLQIHRSIMVDYLGSGYSDHSVKFSYDMEDHAETVAYILEHENITSAIVVGHSMGGTVAIMLAISRPDLVSKLIVGEGNLVPGGGAGTSKMHHSQRLNLLKIFALSGAKTELHLQKNEMKWQLSSQECGRLQMQKDFLKIQDHPILDHQLLPILQLRFLMLYKKLHL